MTKPAPKKINEEVGFLLRLLGEQGDAIRTKLRRQKALKLATGSEVGKAYTPEEQDVFDSSQPGGYLEKTGPGGIARFIRRSSSTCWVGRGSGKGRVISQ